jgi:hypothetical protein
MSIIPIEKVIYTAKAHTTGGRDGGSSRTSASTDTKVSLIPSSNCFFPMRLV